MMLAFEQQRCLVESVNNAITRDIFRCLRQAGKGRVQIRNVDDVTSCASCLDDSRPASKGIDPDTTLKMVSLSSAIDQLVQTRRSLIVLHEAVVGHQYNQSVLGNAKLVYFVEDITEPTVD